MGTNTQPKHLRRLLELEPNHGLEQLKRTPTVPVHPLRVLLLHKGVSLNEAATLLGWSLRKLMTVVGEWRVPSDADRVAGALRMPVSKLFPRRASARKEPRR